MSSVRHTTVKRLREVLENLPGDDVIYPQNYIGDLIILQKDDITSGAVKREASFKVFSFEEERLKSYPKDECDCG